MNVTSLAPRGKYTQFPSSCGEGDLQALLFEGLLYTGGCIGEIQLTLRPGADCSPNCSLFSEADSNSVLSVVPPNGSVQTALCVKRRNKVCKHSTPWAQGSPVPAAVAAEQDRY